ncbi:hypothetical protein EG68_01617 [Paragonimus skrjabini miyazakii]|uniref:Uncharacterized protein n=1 Tax=Paragonimus skrjabini miyazakii TaxID=59628 RepID=A0A8S9Z8Q3_9TREM|nr:hypothetical protein EG68_01617 [Paragonimus skrjabini miyazakii]
MSSNKIQHIPSGVFSGLSNLKILYLHRNKISCLQKGSFNGLDHLQILHLSDNRIQTFSRGSFEDLKRLKYLYLVHNPLICDCRLAWLPPVLIEKEAGGTQWARCAEPMPVQGHHVRDLVPSVLHCEGKPDFWHTAELVLTMIGECRHLKANSPKSEESYCETQEIQCPDGCRCTEITSTPVMQAKPETAYHLDELGLISDGVSVDCSELKLRHLPDRLPSNTKELNLRGNLIRVIPSLSSLNRLERLNTLILDGNRIERIEPSSFATNKHLKKLILSNNSLTSLDHRILMGLNNLEILLLQHNQLTCLNNATFGHNQALKILMLNNNKIRCLSKGIFDQMHLESLSISANPLECDCHLSWLPDWLRDNVDRVIIGPSPPICVQPEELAGTPLASLARYYFTCPKPDTECVSAEPSARSTEMGDAAMQICSSNSAACCAETEVGFSEVSKCPPSCTCESDGVYCSDSNLTEIPSPIPTETTQLYLERNQISYIRSDRLTHLTRLHTL